MKLKLSPVTLALFSTMLVSTQALSVEQLNQINVTALRDSTNYTKEQTQVSVINKNQLEHLQATSVASALSRLSNMSIEGGSRSLAQKPSIRGLGGNRVVQVIDGIRQNFELGHRGSYFIPTSMLAQLEVVKGPSSTLWGSGALGGVVAMRTLNAFDLLKGNQTWGAKLKQSYHSANSLSSTEVAIYGANEKFDVLILPFYNKNSDLRLGKQLEELPYSGLTQQGALLKAGWQINDDQRLEVSMRHSTSKQLSPNNNEMFTAFTPEDFFNAVATASAANRSSLYSQAGGTSDLSQQKVTDNGVSLRYLFNPASSLVNSELTVYTNHTKETEINQRTQANDETQYKTHGFNLHNTSEFDHLALIYGVDFYQDHAKTKREKKSSDKDCSWATLPRQCTDLKTAKYRPDPYDAKNTVLGAYLLSHIKLNEQWVFSPAVRFDSYKSSESRGTKHSESHVSPSATLTFKPTNWLDLNLRYSEAFRAPSLQERYASGNHYGYDLGSIQMVTNFIPNLNLKAEIARNKELNARFHWNNLLNNNDEFELSTALFQNDVKDFIELDVIKYSNMGSPKDFQYRNVQNAKLRGFEFGGRYKTERWSSYINYGLVRAKNVKTGEYLNNINADKLVIGGTYSVVPTKFDVGARINHYFAQNRVPKNSKKYNAYTLVDLTATYAPAKGEWENLRVDFTIENIFDKAYTPAFSLTPGAGRNVKISLGYQF